MITLQQLQYFRELAANGHLTRTAEQLFISQTTLSGTIIKLEKQLGINLFDRVGRTLRLNETGQGYLVYVEQALTALENGQAFIADRREQGAHKVSLSIINSAVWSPLIQNFQTRFPNYAIQLLSVPPNQQRSMLLDRKVNFIIAGIDDLPLDDLGYHVFYEQRLCLYVPGEHPFATRECVSLQDIQHESFIGLSRGQPFRDYCDNLFKKAHLEYKPILECDYLMSSKLVEAGLGVNLTTDAVQAWHARHVSRSTNKFIPLSEDTPRRPMAIIWNPKQYLGQAARSFLDYVISLQFPTCLQ